MWAFSGSHIILVPWFNENVVCVVLINLENCGFKPRIERRRVCGFVVPIIQSTLQEVLQKEELRVMNLNTIHGSSRCHESITLLNFDIEEALYCHGKFSIE